MSNVEHGWVVEHQGEVIRRFTREPDIEEPDGLDPRRFSAEVYDPERHLFEMFDFKNTVDVRRDGGLRLRGWFTRVQHEDPPDKPATTRVEGVSRWAQVWWRTTRDERFLNVDPREIIRRALSLQFFYREPFNDALRVASTTRTVVTGGFLQLDEDSSGDFFTDSDGTLAAESETIERADGDITEVTLEAKDQVDEDDTTDVHDNLANQDNEHGPESDAFYQSDDDLYRVTSVGRLDEYVFDDHSRTAQVSGGCVIEGGKAAIAGEDFSENWDSGDSYGSQGDSDGKWVTRPSLAPPERVVDGSTTRGYKDAWETVPSDGVLQTDQLSERVESYKVSGIIIFQKGSASFGSDRAVYAAREDDTYNPFTVGVAKGDRVFIELRDGFDSHRATGDPDKGVVDDTEVHYVAFTLDSTGTSSHHITAWLDGTKIIDEEASLTDWRDRMFSANELIVGEGSDTSLWDRWDGECVEARFWDAVLDKRTLKIHARPNGDRGAEGSEWAFWYIDQEDEDTSASPTEIRDNSGNGRPLKVKGSGDLVSLDPVAIPAISPGGTGPWMLTGDPTGAVNGLVVRAYDTQDSPEPTSGFPDDRRHPTLGGWDDVDGDFSGALIDSPRRLALLGQADGTITGLKYKGGEWKTDASLADGISDVSGRADATVFELDGTWRAIIGKEGGGFDGYQWDDVNNTWTADSNITSGLTSRTSNSSPAAIKVDGTWRLLVQGSDGTWDGYDWDSANTQWSSNANLTDGLSDVGSDGTVSTHRIDDVPTLVHGSTGGDETTEQWLRTHTVSDHDGDGDDELGVQNHGENARRTISEDRTFGTFEFDLVYTSGDELTWAVGSQSNGDRTSVDGDEWLFVFRVNSNGLIQYRDTDTLPSEWQSLPTPKALTGGSTFTISCKYDIRDDDPANWDCEVVVDSTSHGTVGTRSGNQAIVGMDVVAFGSVVAGSGTYGDPSVVDNSLAYVGHGSGPQTSGNWRAKLLQKPNEIHGYQVHKQDATGTDASITYEFRRSSDGAWQSLTVDESRVWLDDTSDEFQLRAKLDAPDQTTTCEIDDIKLTLYYEYTQEPVVYETGTLDDTYSARKITVTLEDSEGGKAKEEPAGTNIKIEVTPDNWTTVKEINDGGTAFFNPNDISTDDMRFRVTLTASPDQHRTPKVKQWVFEAEGGGVDHGITYKVSRDGGSNYHEVTPGESFTNFGSGESPKDELRWRVEFSNSNTASTPKVDTIYLQVEAGDGFEGITAGTIDAWGQEVSLESYLEPFADLLRRVEKLTGRSIQKSFDPATGDITVDWTDGTTPSEYSLRSDEVESLEWERNVEKHASRVLFYGGSN